MCRGKIHKMLKINNLRAFLRPFLGWRLAFFCAFLVLAVLIWEFQGRSPEAKTGGSCDEEAVWEPMVHSRLLHLGHRCGNGEIEVLSFIGKDTVVYRLTVEKPIRRVVILSSAQIGFMTRLGIADRIVGVGEGKYVVDSALYARIAAGEVAEVGSGPTISLEKVLALKPDLVMTFATGGSYDDYDRLNTLGIPLLVTSEWQEDNPLAKIEWVKLYGMLFGVEALADSVFRQTNEEYLSSFASRLSSDSGGVAGVSPAEGVADAAGGRSEGEASPRVIAGMAYGGVWYAPGGMSYTAHLIKAAGGRYLWEGDTTREMKLSLEEVMLLADSADVWVNPGAFGSVEEVLAAEPRVKALKAFRDKRICQNDGRKGPGGGNDFYESAVARPVKLIADLHDCLFTVNGGVSGGQAGQAGASWYRNIYNF